MTFSNDDNKLKSFIKENAPVPPDAPVGELNRLLAQIQENTASVKSREEFRPSKFHLWWMGGGALVAGFAAFWIFANVQQPQEALELQPNQLVALADSVGEEESLFLDLATDYPTSDIGQEYIGLVDASEVY